MAPRRKRYQPPPEGGEDARPGFYDHGYRSLELRDLPHALKSGLADEIAMLRVSMRRVFELTSDPRNPGRAEKALGTLGLAATRLAKLLQVEREMTGSNSSAYEAINEAISQVLDEMRSEGSPPR